MIIQVYSQWTLFKRMKMTIAILERLNAVISDSFD